MQNCKLYCFSKFSPNEILYVWYFREHDHAHNILGGGFWPVLREMIDDFPESAKKLLASSEKCFSEIFYTLCDNNKFYTFIPV